MEELVSYIVVESVGSVVLDRILQRDCSPYSLSYLSPPPPDCSWRRYKRCFLNECLLCIQLYMYKNVCDF